MVLKIRGGGIDRGVDRWSARSGRLPAVAGFRRCLAACWVRGIARAPFLEVGGIWGHDTLGSSARQYVFLLLQTSPYVPWSSRLVLHNEGR